MLYNIFSILSVVKCTVKSDVQCRMCDKICKCYSIFLLETKFYPLESASTLMKICSLNDDSGKLQP